MKLQKIALAIVATLGVVGTSQAATIVAGQSYTGSGLVIVGDTGAGVAGAGVNGLPSPYNQPQAFSHFKLPFFFQATPQVYSFAGSELAALGAPSPHDQLGVFTFAALGVKDVHYGEWSPENKSGSTYLGTPNVANRVVYYVGDKDGLVLPSSGSVNYTVKGINQFDKKVGSATYNTAVLNGTFTASFTGSGGTLSGVLNSTGTTTPVKQLTLSSTTFNTAGAITGSATGLNQSNVAIGTGTVSGQFFGNQSVAGQGGLAGIAKFSSRQYDTAFGGKN